MKELHTKRVKGSPKRVRMYMALDFVVISACVLVLVAANPFKVQVDIFLLLYPAILLMWFVTHYSMATSIAFCATCEGGALGRESEPCSSCTNGLQMPSNYREYIPRNVWEKLVVVFNDGPTSSMRAEWRDGRWLERSEELAGVAVYGGIALMVILGAIGVGVWLLVYEDESVMVEVSIMDVDFNQDPAPAKIGVRVTSKLDVDVRVKSFRMRVWTDETREHFVLEETGGNLAVPAGESVTWHFDVELHNVDLVEDSIYVEFSMTHRAEGEDADVDTHYAGTKELSEVWEQLGA